MAGIFHFRLKLLFFAILLLAVFQVRSQASSEVDEIIFKVYNQDFKEVPTKIQDLNRTSPQIAQYIKIDYLWWSMISNSTTQTDSFFLSELKSLNEKKSEDEDFSKLIYFIYQIRYENLRNKSFSKYLTIMKFHFFMDNINLSCLKNADSFVQSMFKLMDEVNGFMKYKFLYDNGLNSKVIIEKCRLSLQKIEIMSNSEYKSFDVIKTYLLAKIYKEIENDNQKASMKFTKLSNLFPGNAIFKQTLAECKKG
jgi:hypothetical protein